MEKWIGFWVLIQYSIYNEKIQNNDVILMGNRVNEINTENK